MTFVPKYIGVRETVGQKWGSSVGRGAAGGTSKEKNGSWAG